MGELSLLYSFSGLLKKSFEGHGVVTLSLSKGGKPFKIRYMLRALSGTGKLSMTSKKIASIRLFQQSVRSRCHMMALLKNHL